MSVITNLGPKIIYAIFLHAYYYFTLRALQYWIYTYFNVSNCNIGKHLLNTFAMIDSFFNSKYDKQFTNNCITTLTELQESFLLILTELT